MRLQSWCSWLHNRWLGQHRTAAQGGREAARRSFARPCLELLEDRVTPSLFSPTRFDDPTPDGFANGFSLREAVIANNADTGTFTNIIQLEAGAYNLTRTNATQENAASTGDLDITQANHVLIIRGRGSSGAAQTTVSAAGLNVLQSGAVFFRDRVFHLTSGGVRVVFQDLVITGGSAIDNGASGVGATTATNTTEGLGGAILNGGGSVTLENVVLTQNQVQGRGAAADDATGAKEGRGGAIASVAGNGTVIITGSSLTSNTAWGGNGPGSDSNTMAPAPGVARSISRTARSLCPTRSSRRTPSTAVRAATPAATPATAASAAWLWAEESMPRAARSTCPTLPSATTSPMAARAPQVRIRGAPARMARPAPCTTSAAAWS